MNGLQKTVAENATVVMSLFEPWVWVKNKQPGDAAVFEHIFDDDFTVSVDEMHIGKRGFFEAFLDGFDDLGAYLYPQDLSVWVTVGIFFDEKPLPEAHFDFKAADIAL